MARTRPGGRPLEPWFGVALESESLDGGDTLVKTCTTLLVIGLIASASWAGVSLQVYRADERTPLAFEDPNEPGIYEDIMVGTHLTFVIGSDTPVEWWSGGLWISWEDLDFGTVTARGYNPETMNYEGSILPTEAEAYINQGPVDNGLGIAFSILELTYGPVSGEWFALDYWAEQVGTCLIGLYSYEPGIDTHGDLNWAVPRDAPYGGFWIQGLSFQHVPSRDYDNDTVVNFVDFALWAKQWQQTILSEDPNAVPPGDLNADAFVDTVDLTLFCQYWLERTDIAVPADPNALDPNTPETAL